MLVLTRRSDESLVINDNIVVTILGIEGDKVKLGISAPRNSDFTSRIVASHP